MAREAAVPHNASGLEVRVADVDTDDGVDASVAEDDVEGGARVEARSRTSVVRAARKMENMAPRVPPHVSGREQM